MTDEQFEMLVKWLGENGLADLILLGGSPEEVYSKMLAVKKGTVTVAELKVRYSLWV